jgi:Tol biopolymer transport system component/DNA-binding winged helix-turn-helix (wHTH) protein
MMDDGQLGVLKPRVVYRFGVFELDSQTQELRKHGVRVHLVSQAFQALVLTVERQGDCVTREELRQTLWPNQQCGDFDLRLNKVVNRVRAALGDSADTPRYLETVPRVGYRFLFPVHKAELPVPGCSPRGEVEPHHAEPAAKLPRTASANWRIIAGAFVGLLAGVWAAIFFAPAHLSQILLDPQALTRHAGRESDPSFDPNGEEVVFSWNGSRQDNFNLYSFRRRDGVVKRLTDTPDRDFAPAWSPDGRFIAFLRQVGLRKADLMLLPSGSGSARRLTQVAWAQIPPEIDWTRDSRWIIAPATLEGLHSSLYQISADNGERRQITWPPSNSKGDFFPATSENGSAIAFTRFLNREWNDVFLLPLSTASNRREEPVRLTDFKIQIGRLTWTSGGREIIFSAGGWAGDRFLYRIRPIAGAGLMDLGNVRIEGTQPVYSSRARALAYVRKVQNMSISRIDVEIERGKPSLQPPRRLIVSSAADQQADLSPDGVSIVFSSNRHRNRDLWFARADGSEPRRALTLNEDGATAPRWSPDGRWIAFESRVGGQSNIYLYEVGKGAIRNLTDGRGDNTLPSWSRDGRFVYFCSKRDGFSQIWKVPRDGGMAARVTRGGGRFGIESADGKDLYYTLDEVNSVLHRLSLATGAEQSLVSNVITVPGFAVTTMGIYYLTAIDTGGAGLSYFDFASQSSLRLTSLEKPVGNGFSISPDGKRILFTQRESEVSNLMLLPNFPYEKPSVRRMEQFRELFRLRDRL